jgi:hypothetical protein
VSVRFRNEFFLIYLRIVHAIIKNICINLKKLQRITRKKGEYLQKVKLPEMIPFAIATGKIAYASWVNGSWRMKNNGGGITSLNLEN